MHDTAMMFGKLFFDTYIPKTGAYSLLDVGSKNVNGTLRSVAPKNLTYIGCDTEPGDGVDWVMSSPYDLPLTKFDFIVCTSVLEHVEFPWLLFERMIATLKPNGILYINAPTNGPVHRFPIDGWRFYPDAAESLAEWARSGGFHCHLVEHFIGHRQHDWYNDFVAVYVAGKIGNITTQRMLDTYKPVTADRW